MKRFSDMSRGKKAGVCVLLAVLAAALAVAAGCGEGGPLAAPEGLRVEDETLTWEAVEHAVGYFVEIDGEEYETELNVLSVFTLAVSPRAYDIRVQAYGDLYGPYDNSPWSETLSYTPQIASGWGLRPTEDGMGYEIGAADDPAAVQGKLVVPAAYDGKPVVRVANYGFEDCTGLTGVLMPSAVTEVGNGAFDSCSALKRVLCPSAAAIGEFAFMNCTALQMIRLPQYLETLERGVFNHCPSLEAVELPDGLKEIKTLAFQGCTSLKALHLPASVTKIDPSMISYCPSLTELTVAEGNAVFRSEDNCIIRRSDGELIAGCAVSVIPASVSAIGDDAFISCLGLTEITIPSNVKRVGDKAFWSCEDLRRVRIEEGVEEIGGHNVGGGFDPVGVFWGAKLSALHIPATVTYLSPDLTAGCGEELVTLTVAEGSEVFRSEGNCIVRRSDGELIAGCAGSVIPQGVTRLGDFSFYACPIGEAAIPEGVTEIGKEVFRGSAVTRVGLPSTLRVIGYNAFCGCANLAGISLPAGLEEIGGSAFEASGLRQIVIPESVKRIGRMAFYNCPNALVVTLPDSVETIGSGAFRLAVIFTNASRDDPEGWHQRDPLLGELDKDWDIYCGALLNCNFGWEGEKPYVDSWQAIYDEDGLVRNVSTLVYLKVPVREGYTFMGWATERDGEIVIPKIVENGNEYCFPPDGRELYSVIRSFPKDTIFYAIWEQVS